MLVQSSTFLVPPSSLILPDHFETCSHADLWEIADTLAGLGSLPEPLEVLQYEAGFLLRCPKSIRSFLAVGLLVDGGHQVFRDKRLLKARVAFALVPVTLV